MPTSIFSSTRTMSVHFYILAREGISMSNAYGTAAILIIAILGMGRAIGETMATIMIAGNAAEIPRSLLKPVRTLTSNIALEMSYATGEHREALFATGVILFIIIMILNTVANATSSRRRKSP